MKAHTVPGMTWKCLWNEMNEKARQPFMVRCMRHHSCTGADRVAGNGRRSVVFNCLHPELNKPFLTVLEKATVLPLFAFILQMFLSKVTDS